MRSILVVDDEPSVRDALERALKAQHYVVITAADGRQALDAIADERPELVLLDVLMPVMDGFEACRRLRELGDRTPVLMLTARDAVGDRVEGLDAGADDYVVKPFALEELLARCRALLRRSGVPGDEPLRFADVVLDPVTREVIFDRVWGYDFGPTSNTLEVYVGYLRRKTEGDGEPRLIHTVRGVGFMLREGEP